MLLTLSLTLLAEVAGLLYGIQCPKSNHCRIQGRIFHNAMLMPHHWQKFWKCKPGCRCKACYGIIYVKMIFTPRKGLSYKQSK